MPIEIERKFLVVGDGWRGAIVRSRAIRQGYVGQSDHASVRLRRIDDQAVITIKSREPGMRRAEFEYPIPPEDADAMLGFACGDRLIDKTRYEVEHQGALWEVDVFHGRLEGLIIAEIELQREDQEVVSPDWIGREVTHDPRYYNDALASCDQLPDTI